MDAIRKSPQKPPTRQGTEENMQLLSSPRNETKVEPIAPFVEEDPDGASITVAAPSLTSGAIPLPSLSQRVDAAHEISLASSSSSEFTVCFDDDFEFEIDWEKEKAKPFYNSITVYPPRVPIPEWAEWDFAKSTHFQELDQNHWKDDLTETHEGDA